MLAVPAHHTSQRCNACGHIDPANRQTQSDFVCAACGHRANADLNAACNIRDRGLGLWGQGPIHLAPAVVFIMAEGLSVTACGGYRVSGLAKQETGDREIAQVAA